MKDKDQESPRPRRQQEQEEQDGGALRHDQSSHSLQRAGYDIGAGARQSSNTVDSKYSRSVDNMQTIEHRAPPRIATALEGKSRSIQLERHQRPVDADDQVGPMSGRPLKGPQLHSVDRLAQVQDERRTQPEEVNLFRNRSKDWYQRKDREHSAENSEVVHKDIAQKYKDAFKNLSQELKKKMHDVSNSKRQSA